MTDIASNVTAAASTDPAAAVTVSFETNAELLRRAWKALSATQRSGTFGCFVSPAGIRLHLGVDHLHIDAGMPVHTLTGVPPMTEVGIELAIESFSVLNSDSLPETIKLILPELRLECHSACNIDPLSRGIGVQN